MIAAGVFFACMLGFAALGAASSRASTGTREDYLLAGRGVPAWLAALSAVATNSSGYMFIGQIGLTYAIGLRSLWLAVGWVLGDALVWALLYRRVREVSEARGALSVPSMLGEPGDGRRLVTRAAAVLVLVFLGLYAAAQLQAGSKALTAVFGWHPAAGALLGAAIVLWYSYSGGIRASIWTDAAQAFVMLGAMAALLVWALSALGGFAGLFERLRAIDPALVDPFGSSDAPWGFMPWALGWLGGGIGVVGQPTIVVRAMTLRTARDVPRAGAVYFSWYAPFYAATICLGLCTRALLPELGDPELAMPTLAVRLLPEALVGLMLAGIFAATMSTADSQILSCSAALTEDLAPRLGARAGAHKLATAAVTALALGIALLPTDGVLVLVLYAWSALGVTLGPLVCVRALGGPLPPPAALAMMAAGLGAMWLWRALGLAPAMYEIVPGLAAAGLTYALTWPWARRRASA